MRPPIGGTTVTFEKRIDGLAVVVEQVRMTQGTLSFFTMWIDRK